MPETPWNELLSWQRTWFERGFYATGVLYGCNPVAESTPEHAYRAWLAAR